MTVDARMWMINRDGTNERKVHEHQPVKVAHTRVLILMDLHWLMFPI